MLSGAWSALVVWDLPVLIPSSILAQFLSMPTQFMGLPVSREQ